MQEILKIVSLKMSVCPSKSNICQLRLDLDQFVMAGPVSTVSVVSNTLCDQATFTATSGGEKHVICGTNSGHHLILDLEDNCNTLGRCGCI